MIFSEVFDLQKFVSNVLENKKYLPKIDIQTRILKNGKVVDGEIKTKK